VSKKSLFADALLCIVDSQIDGRHQGLAPTPLSVEKIMPAKTLSVLLLAVITATASPSRLRASNAIDLSKAKIVVLNQNSKIISNAADMLADEIEKRTRIRLDIIRTIPNNNPLILIATADRLAAESFPPPPQCPILPQKDAYALWTDTSRPNAPTICAAGYDDRAALFAAGRLLRLLDMQRDALTLDDDIKISTAPKHPLRGHQLGYRPKTNSYDGWDIKMWEQYYRDLIVFGTNAVELIPPESDDAPPESDDADDSPLFPKPQMEMMIAMSHLADDYGLDVWIWYPVVDEKNGDPQAVAKMLAQCRRVFQSLPRIDAVFVPGGDPGDIHPAHLLPLVEKTKKPTTSCRWLKKPKSFLTVTTPTPLSGFHPRTSTE